MKAYISLLLLSSFGTLTLAQTPVAVPSLANQCMNCLLTNSTYTYCISNKICYDRALPVGFGCATPNKDIMETNACSRTVINFSASPMIVKSETDRKADCIVDDANTPLVNENTVCKAQAGTTVTYSIPTDGRYTVFLNCPTTVPICYFTYSNTAGNNMKVYMLKSSTLSSEAVITQEINSYGSFQFRKATIYLLFVSLDAVNPQSITFTYLTAKVLSLGVASLIGIATLILSF